MNEVATTGITIGGAQPVLGMAPVHVLGARAAAAHSSPVAAHSPNASVATGFDRRPFAHHQPPTPLAGTQPHQAVASVYAAGRS